MHDIPVQGTLVALAPILSPRLPTLAKAMPLVAAGNIHIYLLLFGN